MTTSTQTKVLKTAIGSYGHTAALKDGSIKPRGIEFELVEVAPIINAFRRMCRQLEFDVSEMAITTYLCAKAHNKPFTALPVFLVRAFHHGAVQYNTKAGVSSPKDLEGKKVGVRAWTVTTGVWAKGILAQEYGVDLEKVNWVIVDEEHVAEYQTPKNVTTVAGGNLSDMLASGELAAAIGIGRVESPDVKPLVENAGQAQTEWFKKTGIYPINHTLVVKNEVLQSNPAVASDLFNAFKSARDLYVSKLASSTAEEDAALKRTQTLVGDPLPYGVSANRKAIDAIVDIAVGQHILPRKFSIEEIFAAGTTNT